MMIIKRLVLLSSLTASQFTSPSAALANDETDIDFIINTIGYFLYHEAGHALVDQFDLPVVGQEEDAVDAFAAIQILDLYENDRDILLDTAEAMLLMHEDVLENDDLDYFDEHDLDIQRAYRIICYGYGTDQKRYEEAADWVEMPQERRETCTDDTDLSWASWDTLLEGSRLKEGERQQVISVAFLPTSQFQLERATLEESGILPEVSQLLGETFDWPNPMTIDAKECGEPNAYYDPDTVSITICYEMLSELTELDALRQ
ncbi:MAG: DUF4344 domain-containing metallopeptidase [Hyphomicrobiales bacterium]